MANHGIIIQAGGRGSRLSPFTDYLPKVLKTFGGKTFLQHIKEMFGDVQTTLILSSRYKDFVENSDLGRENKILFDEENRGDLSLIPEAFDQMNVDYATVIWGDIISLRPCLRTFPDFNEWFGVIAKGFDIPETRTRLTWNGHRVPGVFQMRKDGELCEIIRQLPEPKMEALLEALKNREILMKTFTDFKELGTLTSIAVAQQGNYSPARSWNTTYIDNERFYKTTPNAEREAEWLKTCYGDDFVEVISVPNTLSMPRMNMMHLLEEATYEMRHPKHTFPYFFIKGEYDSDFYIDKNKKQIESIIKTLRNIHQSQKTKPISFVQNSIFLIELLYTKTMNRFDQYLNKIDKRAEKYRDLISSFAEEAAEFIIADLRYNQLLHFVHGDPTLNNCVYMADRKKGEFAPETTYYFIDPKTDTTKIPHYGYIFYDYAKLWYSISGYTVANSGWCWTPEDQPLLDVEKMTNHSVISTLFGSYYAPQIIRTLPLLWISFAGYATATPAEAIFGFQTGVQLIEHLQRKKDETNSV